jgi:hypothetical protein
VNKRLVKRELANFKMLIDIAKTQGFNVFFWSFADGLCRRLHVDNLYHRTHYYRHEACKAYLKKTMHMLLTNIGTLILKRLEKSVRILLFGAIGSKECQMSSIQLTSH